MYNVFLNGFIWSVIGQYGRIISALIINMILSRILTPEEFGQVAMITVFITFFQLMTEAGFGPAIIQQKDFKDRDFSSLFNISVIFAIVFAIAFGIFGYGIASFYSSEEYVYFSWLLSLVILFSGMQIVPNAMLLKRKKFKIVNLISLVVTIISGSAGIAFAVLGMGVYALIYSSILNALLTFILITKISSIRLAKRFDISSLRKIWFFSKNQFGFNFINYFARNADNLLVGKFMSADALGNYNKSYQLLMYPVTIFGGVITPILQPILSDYQDDVEVIRSVYFKLVKVLALITVPFSIFLVFSSREIIFVMFGSQWKDAVLPFSILATTVWIQVIGSTAGAIFQSRNKAKDLFITGSFSAFVIVTLIIIGVIFGTIKSVAICVALAYFWNFVQSFWFLTHRALNSNLIQFGKIFKKPAYLALIMLITFSVFNFYFSNVFQLLIVDLIVRVVVFIVIFTISIIALGEYKQLISFVKKK
ncbi:lipopolysaccharide biosynthesis protein [Leuconostoc lactis]|uniref:lipopolysaccharide biosynthesis protein n=1 Tax=Leuconostoc lactis TaxID=1246 RepID=UPI0021C18924|nr:lipopolysaccharide biosynthesis protein [Leuconostoc lactis]MCT8388164.1 lipopolysaccharide biosynthesis protein [Leuconostoc lactis]